MRRSLREPLRRRLATNPRIDAAVRLRSADPWELVAGWSSVHHDREVLAQVRGDSDVCWLEDAACEEPLVTIRIATYNRPQQLLSRAVASALEQTYRNIEVLVVGDGCDDRTARALDDLGDPRVRYVNLGWPGQYPLDPRHRWLVAGSLPMNVGTVLARGAWIAPCDDDDELTRDHVEVLLRHAKRHRVELVYSQARDVASGNIIGSWPLTRGAICHGALILSSGLRFMRYRDSCWRLGEPADWNMWSRMRKVGVRIGFLDRITYLVHPSGGPRQYTTSRDS